MREIKIGSDCEFIAFDMGILETDSIQHIANSYFNDNIGYDYNSIEIRSSVYDLNSINLNNIQNTLNRIKDEIDNILNLISDNHNLTFYHYSTNAVNIGGHIHISFHYDDPILLDNYITKLNKLYRYLPLFSTRYRKFYTTRPIEIKYHYDNFIHFEIRIFETFMLFDYTDILSKIILHLLDYDFDNDLDHFVDELRSVFIEPSFIIPIRINDTIIPFKSPIIPKKIVFLHPRRNVNYFIKGMNCNNEIISYYSFKDDPIHLDYDYDTLYITKKFLMS